MARLLRRKLVSRAFRKHPVRTTLALAHFFTREAALRLCPPGFTVALLGPDGSGKSTVSARLERDAKGLFVDVVHLHLRPRVLRGLEHGGVDAVDDPHGSPPRGLIASWVKLVFYVLDYWLGYVGHLAPLLAKGFLVVWDRHLLDVAVDPARVRYGGGMAALRLAVRLIPQPDAIVVLDVPRDVAFSRKQEVSAGEFDRQRARYRRLAESRANGVVIDASGSPDLVSAEVLSAVLRIMADSRRWRVAQ